ncbi:hypothetical protein ACFOOM_13730 [Streptomyces echinoruber]|uniref:Uncharacterized protein n=1 Tax=Streptomyces echinoruber TaxID=68898 RepID=A0A918VGU7_9ACTN|nr:hypothetical protein [Streptomyces echinoruber]GGZ95332.1 hypothetical protein GCM10010389_37940 [Streptomyces echinoruber]
MPETKERSRDLLGRVLLGLFRCVMVLIVAFFAVRTYEETAIAVARATGGLRTVRATVAGVQHITHERCTGAGQDTDCSHKDFWSSDDVIVRADGATRTVTVEDAPSFAEGQQVRLGMWHDTVVQIDEYTVHSAWTGDGFLLVVSPLLYPLAMAYTIVVVTALLARLLGRRGRARLDVGERLHADIFGVVTGLAVCLILVFVSAARDNGNPPWWPVVPAGAGIACAALVLLRNARAATEPGTAVA